MTQPMPGKPAEDAENELDIRGLFRTLWAGKLWIIGMGLAFALIALAYTFFARQEWRDLLIAGLTAANAVKVASCIFADGHALNGKGSIHIAEVALMLGRGSILDAHGLASF